MIVIIDTSAITTGIARMEKKTVRFMLFIQQSAYIQHHKYTRILIAKKFSTLFCNFAICFLTGVYNLAMIHIGNRSYCIDQSNYAVQAASRGNKFPLSKGGICFALFRFGPIERARYTSACNSTFVYYLDYQLRKILHKEKLKKR